MRNNVASLYCCARNMYANETSARKEKERENGQSGEKGSLKRTTRKKVIDIYNTVSIAVKTETDDDTLEFCSQIVTHPRKIYM